MVQHDYTPNSLSLSNNSNTSGYTNTTSHVQASQSSLTFNGPQVPQSSNLLNKFGNFQNSHTYPSHAESFANVQNAQSQQTNYKNQHHPHQNALFQYHQNQPLNTYQESLQQQTSLQFQPQVLQTNQSTFQTTPAMNQSYQAQQSYPSQQYSSFSNMTNSGHNQNNLSAFAKNPNFLRGLSGTSTPNFDNSKGNGKASKIENEDTSLSKYGNAFFGQSLWEKSEIYQSDKIGVKFEYLEVDDFLNENGLNEADVEFLDQLQKFESGDANNKAAQQPANKSQTSPSPFAPSPSSQSSSSSSNHSLKSLLDAPMSSNEKTQSNRSATSAHSINMSVGQNMYKDKDTLNKTPQKQLNKKQEKNWSANDLSIGGSISDYDSEDDDDELDTSLKMTEEELKLNPVMKKSKKNSLENMMMTSSKKAKSLNNSSLDYSLVGLAEIDIENDLLNSDSDESDFDDDLDKSVSQKVCKKRGKKFVPDELKDDKYWARRRKNNVAAKRSRDARRMKENQIAVRATYLERENDLLRKQLEDFKRENKVLKIKLSRFEANPSMEMMNAK